MPLNINLSYYPWITQHVDPAVIYDNIQTFADAVAAELAPLVQDTVLIKVQPPMEVPQQIAAITSGETQIALMNPLGFVFAHNVNPAIDVACLALRLIDGQVGDSYFSQIYTNKQSGITTLAGLKNKRLAFGSPQSTSNFLVSAYELLKNDIHPLISFKQLSFLGGHDTVAKAVYNGEVDAGAGHDGVIIDLSHQPDTSDAAERLITVHRSQPIPSDPIVLNVPDAGLFYFIQKALLSAAEKSPAREAIAAFWGNAQGLKATKYDSYAYLLTAIQELNLQLKDIFST